MRENFSRIAICHERPGTDDSSQASGCKELLCPRVESHIQVFRVSGIVPTHHSQTRRGFAKRRIHHRHVVAFAAEVDEGEALRGVVGEEAALESAAVLGLLGVGFERVVNPLLGPLPELFVGDAGEVRRISSWLGLLPGSAKSAACSGRWALFPGRLASAMAVRISSSMRRREPASPARVMRSKIFSSRKAKAGRSPAGNCCSTNSRSSSFSPASARRRRGSSG